MRNDFCTGYLAHSAKGKEWEKHKYVAKVKLASGKYFYFYSDEQYQKFLKKVKERGDAEREKVNEKFGKTTKKEEKKKATETESSKKKKGSGSSSKSSSSSKKGKTSTGSKSSSKKSSSSGKTTSSSKSEKSGSSSKKTSSSSKTSADTTKTTSASNTNATTSTASEAGVKKTAPTLSAYKYQYDLKDDDIDTYSGDTASERVTANRVKEIIDDMIDKYPDDASGYLISSFSDNISYQFQWVKENGTIKLVDPDTGIEIAADAGLMNSTQINLFRTDNKKKKS